MIQISLTSALVFYSALLCALAIAIWTHTEIVSRRIQAVLTKQFLWRCTFCGYIYLDEQAERLSRCPRCDCYNSTEDKLARYIPAETIRVPESPREPQRDSSHRKRPHQRRRGPRRRR
ncbi:MAG TPA: hypothetical protein P5318_16420 [Candidatus Hydrogenedentes bacterium]|nr:hypothetical protein [Candidatus Hydrogenedentota bacterium]HRT21701.1 hypothetical protein [Candidatus Hydrogenedentota bacterium]HRT66542.1 hypothetical protein [Candidatus Hydrogenedentota bacterium]